MADGEDQSSKTEEATERKLSKLREEGNVPTSKEVNHLFALIGMLVVVGLAAPWSFMRLLELTGALIQNAGTSRLDGGNDIGAALSHILFTGLVALLPVLVVMLLLGYFGGVVQNGPLWSAKTMEPKLEKISVIAGFKRLFSLKAVAELVKAMLKFSIVGGAMGFVVWIYVPEILLLADAPLMASLGVTWRLMLAIIFAALAIMVLLAGVDLLFQRFQYFKQHMMSRKELKDEMRESEGDPHIKQRQRQIRMEQARKRMMSAVPKADVVITNPTHYSVALKYDVEGGDAAPRVVAKGVDHVAMRIREVAKEHNVPLYEDPPLARALYAQAEIDEEIPLQLYEVVAKVIAFVFDLKRKRAA
jgi:flagellar biosynthetic protein FlhB